MSAKMRRLHGIASHVQNSPAADSGSVVVFRKRLLPYSETFIAAQGHALRRYRPVFAGFHPDRRGLHHLEPAECEWIAAQRWRAELGRIRMRLGGPPPRHWLERIRARNPVLVHAHFGADGHDAIPLARALSVPLVTTVHGHDVIGQLKAAQAGKLARLFREACAIIAVSKYLREQVAAAGCAADKIVQHYIGIDLAKFPAERREADEPTLLFVGRLVHSKGAALAIETAAQLQEEFPDLRLVIVGDGPMEAELKARAAQVLRSCTFTGPITPAQVRDWMQRAWLFLAPRLTLASGYAEALGMVFLEAQACGLPVVATRNGGIAEAVAHGRTGLLTAEGDMSALVAAARQLLAAPQVRAAYSRNAAQHVAEHFDIARQTRILEGHYAEWISAASRSAA